MWLTDVRYALRLWRRHRALLAVSALSLGLGIGATTTMYSVVNTVAFYDLGFRDVDRLVVLWSSDPEHGNTRQPPSWELVQSILQHGKSFEEFGFFQGGGAPVTLSGAAESSRVQQIPVDPGAFTVVGARPLLGRTYRPEDFEDVVKHKEARSIVISYGGWQRRLGGRSDVIGTTIRVDGEPRTIIGVMPKGFSLIPWEDEPAFWAANDLSRIPTATWMIAVGRLEPGVSLEAAQQEATAIRRQYLQDHGENPGNSTARLELLHDAFFQGATNALTFLLGAVSFVLLIACANVANLLLAAGTARQKELALRASVGAGRRRLLRQLLVESVLLSLVGGTFGVLLALAGTRLFVLILPTGFPALLGQLHIDWRVLGFALAASLVSGLIFGLLPAIRATRLDLGDVLKDGSRGSGGSHGRARAALLVAEVGLSMVLLVGAGLMMRGFMREQNDLPGFSTDHLLTADILLGSTKYFDKTPDDINHVTPQVETFYDQVLERVRALPGVRKASIISRLPMQVDTQPFAIVGRPVPDPGKEPRADFNEVDSQLFDTLGIKVLRGRGIEDRDVEAAPWVAVVNKTFADRYFPGEDPLGKAIRVSMGYPPQPQVIEEPQVREIVGVVADVTYPSFFDEKLAAIYIPFRQHLWEYAREDEWLHTRQVLVARTAVDPLTLAHQVSGVVEQVDRDQTATDVMTMEQRVARRR